MKKTIYKLLSICLLAFVFIVLKNTKVQAASASLKANTTEPTEGQTVTVTASVTAGAWNLQFEGNGKAETIYGYTNSNANASDSKSITFTAGSAGTKYTFKLEGDMTDISSDNSEPVSKSITITVKAPATPNPEQSTTPAKKSTEARLSNFGIKPNDFSGFKRDKYEYSTTVPNSVAEVEVYATALDKNAKVEGAGKVALKEGNNTVKVTVTAEAGNTKTYTLTIKRKTATEETSESGEVRLKSLGIKPEEYDFKGFNSEKTEYSVEVPNEVNEIEVYATAMNSNAQITGTGMIELKEGKNDLKVEVIAANGAKKIYTLEVTRKEKDGVSGTTEEKFGLASLSIEGLTLKPSFKVGTYEYTVELTEDLTALNIQAKANEENATVEIIGNENLQQGENVITILVKSKKTDEVATYQIIVNKNVVEETVQTSWLRPSTWGKEEKIKISIIIVLIILIICVIVLKINISKEAKNANEMDLPGAEELDRAMAEHQELSEEPSHFENVETEEIQRNQVEQNYIEDIAKNKFGDVEGETDEKAKRKGRHF